MFDSSGPVEVQVTYNGGDVDSAKIWPQAYGIEPSIDGNVITIPLAEPKNIVLEINGDMYDALQIFANPIETDVPSPTDPNVMFFEPGLHAYGSDPRITRETVPTHYGGRTTTQDVIYVPSGTTVYIQGGAVVQAQIKTNPFFNQAGWQNAPRTNDITIRGRGVIDVSRWCGDFTDAARSRNPEMPAIAIFNSDHVTVEGVVVVNPERQQIHIHTSTDVTVDNFKGFTAMLEGDGIVSTGGNSHVTVKNSYLRTSDDALVSDSSNNHISFDNIVVFGQKAHSIMAGVGNPYGTPLDNYSATNIYIVNHYEAEVVQNGVIGIAAGQGGLVTNMVFKNIVVERNSMGSLFKITPFAPWNSTSGNIRNISFQDIYYTTGPNEAASSITGIDSTHTVDGVQINNLVIDGRTAANVQDANLKVGKYAVGVRLYAGDFQPTASLIGINPSADTGAPIGAAKTAAALDLPTKVSVATSSGDVDAYANWDLSGVIYDPTATTPQTFAVPGTVTLPIGIDNPDGVALATSIRVTTKSAELVAQWKFDEGSGTTAGDSSGKDNTGTLIGNPTWTDSGKVGGALAFNGGSRVEVSPSATLNATGDETVSLWFKTSQASNGYYGVVRQDQRFTPLQLIGGGKAQVAYWPNGSSSAKTLVFPWTYNDDSWHHYAASYDHTLGLKVYVDGHVVASDATNLGPLPDATRNMMIGAAPWGEAYSGLLDDVCIFDRAMSQADVTRLIQTGCQQKVDPKLALGAPSVEAGASVDAALSGFAPDSTVSIWLDDQKLAEAAFTAEGTLDTQLLIPAGTTAGTHQVVVKNANSETQVSAQLDVTEAPGGSTPEIAPSIGSVQAGASVNVQLQGFAPNQLVELWLHSTPVKVGEVTTSGEGSAVVPITVPADTVAGEHALVATDTDGAELARTSLTVTAIPTDGGTGGGNGGAGGSNGSGPGSDLAMTGMDAAAWSLAAAIGLALMSIGAVLLRRRRRMN
ncbi:LamG-like jellyroll fold domain-containing protein [Agromyces sp. Root81]|uniref:LamG-like jellyroll fold domain-containing protein n=1 Tax=Agromyces sp. Root81 TaxID=1736601 RepID=UPI00138F2A1C|nr:LamG-like jellyroll fold domain-containing protein [Agromyces sp. Root81]